MQDEFLCPKCGGDVRVAVNLYLDIPGRLRHHLSKKNLRSKDVQVMGAGWPTMLVYCVKQCGYSEKFKG